MLFSLCLCLTLRRVHNVLTVQIISMRKRSLVILVLKTWVTSPTLEKPVMNLADPFYSLSFLQALLPYSVFSHSWESIPRHTARTTDQDSAGANCFWIFIFWPSSFCCSCM